jgi:membrane associated rhomboid family serine protease
MRLMDCVACNGPLLRLNSATSLHCWTCNACRGVVAEIRPLRRSVPPARMKALEAAIRGGPIGQRACPRCALRMTRASVPGGDGAITIDGCSSCSLAWFDRGELRNLQNAEALDEPHLAALTPEQRQEWRLERLRRDIVVDDEPTPFEIVALALGIPIPQTVDSVRRPYVTWGLCSVGTLTSLTALGGDFLACVRKFGLIAEQVRTGHFSGLMTHFFLHVDLFHLAGNMAFLAMYGWRVEQVLRPVRFAVLVAFATVWGGLLHAAFAPDPEIPLIGASGGVSGVIAAHAALLPHARVRMRFFDIPAWCAFGVWLVLQAIGVAKQIHGMSPVSALGHVGGAAAGLALGFMWKSHARAIEPRCA